MSNLCNQTLTLSDTAGIVENESRGSLTPLWWSRFGCTSYLGVKNKHGYQGLS